MILITKLNNGDDIVSQTKIVTSGKDEDAVSLCLLIKPCQVIMVPTESGSGIGIQVIPYMPFAKDHSIPMPLDCIMTQVEPTDELRNRYNAMFGSGIQVPDNKIILN